VFRNLPAPTELPRSPQATHPPPALAGQPVFGTVALESGAQKPINTIFCGDPQEAVAIGRQAIDGKIFKPIHLPEGTKRILLRWQACGTFQQANQRPE
jgi:hypothetical protein